MTSLLKHFRLGSNRNPVRDWLALLTLSIMVFAGIVVWNIWAFDTVASGGAIGAPAVTAPPIFSRSSLDAVHAVFSSRADEESKYQTGAYRYADPAQ
ncbi:MAG: hypothetical protein KGH56_03335 [Patescibacteria group bacterium]|nr:hypothetical protein [Patescibacteria group bacterium]